MPHNTPTTRTLIHVSHTSSSCTPPNGLQDEAEEAYTKALGLVPHDGATCSALGLTYHLRGSLSDAIETYHKALAARPSCAVTQDLLTEALQEHCRACCQTDDPGLM